MFEFTERERELLLRLIWCARWFAMGRIKILHWRPSDVVLYDLDELIWKLETATSTQPELTQTRILHLHDIIQTR